MNQPAPALSLERVGAIAHLRLVRPERANAMSAAFWREWPQRLQECSDDPAVRVLVITAEGRNFSGGMDLEAFELMQRGRDSIEGARWRSNFRNNLLRLQNELSALETLRFPVLAAVQGASFGAAVDLLCACDVRYAARDACIVVHETNIGMVPDCGTLPRLARLMPEGIVRELVFSGRPMPAGEAHRWGFFNRVFEDAGAAVAALMELAGEIAARSPTALWGSKEMLNYGRDHSAQDTLRYVAAWQSGAISFEDIAACIGSQRRRTGQPPHADVHLTRDLFDDGR